MDSQQKSVRRIAVIGGGISGLAAAHRLVELASAGGESACELVLLESRSRLGGVVSTVHQDGFQVEQSADNFITTSAWGLDLCKRLGLAEELIQTNPQNRRTYVLRRGRLYKLPDGFLMMAPTRLWPLALTPILSPWGKLRAGWEYFIPAGKEEGDESMASFARRRLGREAFERLIEPLVSAVYAADMEKLSLDATLPRFREMERRCGSLIRAMRQERAKRGKAPSESGARYSMFVTLRRGLSSIVEAIADRLPQGSVRLQTPLERIERGTGGGWILHFAGLQERFDGLVMATPAPAAARLLEPVDAELAAMLGSIAHSGTAVLSVGYAREQIAHPLDGMGVVVPAVEQSPILACSFSSQKYAHRAPEGAVLLRVFAGGARRPELARMDGGQLQPLLLGHLAKWLGIRGEPVFSNVAHWPETMPQYHVGHKQLVERIRARAAELPNFQLIGSAYRGVGIPDCIHGGRQADQRLVAGSGAGAAAGSD